ncbi:unnamed protein product [Dicrocoelium dendriticum]|nr:unnamed protein product [Dicrocoelium dendriticum]
MCSQITRFILEAKREDLRVHQRNLVTEKKLLHVPGSDRNDLKRSEIPGVRSLGKLWRLRLACRQAAPGKQLLRPLLLPRLRNTSVSKTTYCLPDFLYLAADASRWSLSTSSQLRWLLDAAFHGGQSGPSNTPVYYEVGDGAVLIPDAYGCVGKEEISR